MNHWLLYTSHREHGGIYILGVFCSYAEAEDEYIRRNPTENDQYWHLCHIECWDNNERIMP